MKTFLKALFIFVLVATLFVQPAQVSAACSTTLSFSGMTWTVSNNWTIPSAASGFKWNSCNASVDSSGRLHLKLIKTSTGWTGAELRTNSSYGFGTYYVQVVSRLDNIPNSAVFGFFPYAGPSGQNEIDIEISKWGNPTGNNLNYVVYPAISASPCCNKYSTSKTLEMISSSTHTFTWTATKVGFKSLFGLTTPSGTSFASWSYAPSSPTAYVPQKSMPLMINYWVHKSNNMGTATYSEIIVAKIVKP